MTDFWDDKELATGGEYVKFEQPGDTISGTVTAIRKHAFDDGKAVPQVSLTTAAGDDKIVTAGQVRLQAALVELRPRVGDLLTITYTREEKRPGGKTLKHFDVNIGPTQAAPATPAAPVAAAGADPLTGWDTVAATTTAPAPAAPAAGKPAQAKEYLAAGVPAAEVAELVGLPLNIVTALANTL